MAENKARTPADNGFEPPYTTLHVGVVQGGTAVNITAEHCMFSHEVRVIPGEEGGELCRALPGHAPPSSRRR